jgi:hypothetical protein
MSSLRQRAERYIGQPLSCVLALHPGAELVNRDGDLWVAIGPRERVVTPAGEHVVVIYDNHGVAFADFDGDGRIDWDSSVGSASV